MRGGEKMEDKEIEKINFVEEFRKMKAWLITDGRFDIRVVERIKLIIE